MKIIEQSHEILHMDGLDLIERAGRTCYKSADKIGCSMTFDEWANFHGEGIPPKECEVVQYSATCPLAVCPEHTANRFVKMLIKRGHEAMIEHGGATVKFTTNRSVTHELVRHRVASFGQESTRYVNYGDKEMEFIRPVWSPEDMLGTWGELVAANMPGFSAGDAWFVQACADAEAQYKRCLVAGWRPEQAREVLPNSLKTEIVVTANYREWRHIFKLRAIGTTGKPHPQMQALMLPVLEDFKQKLPALFGDINEEKC